MWFEREATLCAIREIPRLVVPMYAILERPLGYRSFLSARRMYTSFSRPIEIRLTDIATSRRSDTADRRIAMIRFAFRRVACDFSVYHAE
jgi:hypothetical protein